ncbi:MAG: DUF4838 domain-containing protein [Lentisphaeria bacterium]|nr:DUF4838 domain-containing protein [Lentisphaeria bacterium]
MKHFSIVIGLTLSFVLSGIEITSKSVILAADFKGIPDKHAVSELQIHLQKIFQSPVAVKNIKDVKNPVNAIILKSDPALGFETWKITSDGKNLYISGGFPRGLYFAVHRFLENHAGVRWFTQHESYIPQLKKITVPDNKVFQGTPAFPKGRNIHASTSSKLHSLFMSRHCAGGNPFGPWPSEFASRGLGGCHTFYLLTKDIPKEKSHLLPLDNAGNRVKSVNNVGANQVCFYSKGFRAYAKSKIGEMIKKHEAYITKHKLHRPSWLQYIDISQNDNNSFCQCKGCKDLYKKYGAISGAMLEFINDIAAAYPDYMFKTFAYGPTVTPPRGIRARDNVMIEFAFLGDKNGYADVLRPLSAASNAAFMKFFKEWDKIVKHKSIWCYHRLYKMSEAFDWPQAGFWYIGEDFKFYRDIGALRIFDENEFGGRAFHDLHVYLAAALSADPDRDVQKLTDEFFKHQYGPAEKEMRGFADYLKKRLDAIKGRIPAKPLRSRECFDVEFFKVINDFLDKAEKKAAGNPKLLERILIERTSVDYAALYLWDEYAEKLFPDRNFLCDRLIKNLKVAQKRYFPASKNFMKNHIAKIEALRKPLPIPKGMEKLDVFQYNFRQHGGDDRYCSFDPDAAYQTACKLGPIKGKYAHANQPMVFGWYDVTLKKVFLQRTIKPEEVKQDEKYHLYYMGRCVPPVSHRLMAYGHRTWRMPLGRLFNNMINPQDPDREYDIYISCKFTGPAYVKGSTREDAVYVDKIVVVRQGIRNKK